MFLSPYIHLLCSPSFDPPVSSCLTKQMDSILRDFSNLNDPTKCICSPQLHNPELVMFGSIRNMSGLLITSELEFTPRKSSGKATGTKASSSKLKP